MPTVINPDDFLETEHGRVWTAERSAEAWNKAFAALDAELARQRDAATRLIIVCGLQGAGKTTWIREQEPALGVVYFDAALPRARHRAPIIEIARRHRASVEAVWIATPLAVALDRNRRRPPDKVVPEESVRSVASAFEGPAATEGFERITVIANDAGE